MTSSSKPVRPNKVRHRKGVGYAAPTATARSAPARPLTTRPVSCAASTSTCSRRRPNWPSPVMIATSSKGQPKRYRLLRPPSKPDVPGSRLTPTSSPTSTGSPAGLKNRLAYTLAPDRYSGPVRDGTVAQRSRTPPPVTSSISTGPNWTFDGREWSQALGFTSVGRRPRYPTGGFVLGPRSAGPTRRLRVVGHRLKTQASTVRRLKSWPGAPPNRLYRAPSWPSR
jgi:hypothetical protein